VRQVVAEVPVVVLLLLTQLEVWFPALRTTTLEGSRPVLAATALAMTLPLLARRRFPIAVAISTAVVFSLQSLLLAPPDTPGRVAALMLACGALGAYTEAGRAALGLAVVLALLVTDMDSLADGVFVALLLGAPWVGGVLVRRYRVLLSLLEEQREVNARYAVAAERARIAREMHDVLAHTLSTVAIQAEAASQFLDRPERARPWLDSIGVSVREAMSEVRVLIGVLREADPGEDSPQAVAVGEGSVPGLADLPRLVAQANAPPLTATIVMPGELPPVTSTSGIAAYRIVQEALSNVRKHARASRVVVEVRVDGECFEISVIDDGTGSVASAGEGHGLRGMKERAQLCGGQVRTGPSDGGGFEVRARLPIAVAAP
jgi:signal transduction histidine kinase